MMTNNVLARLPLAPSFITALTLAALGLGQMGGCTTLQTQAPINNSVNSASSAAGYGVPATDRTLAQRILDKSIVNTAKANINAIDPTLHQRSRIGVDSFYSTVLLTGEVPDAQTKAQVVNIVSSMPDVKQVYDRLHIEAQKGASYTVHDGYLSSKLGAKIVANPAIKSSQIKVVTDDGVVYVLGKLTPTQRGHLVNIVESTVGVRELVILTQLIDDNGALIDEASVSQEIGLQPPDIHAATEAATLSDAPVPSAQPALAAAPLSAPPTQSDQPPTQPTTQPTNQPTNQSSGSSAYIEMYKHQVPGWQ